MSIPKLLAVFLLLCLFLTACTATADNRLGGLRRVSLNTAAAGYPPAAFSCPYPFILHHISYLDTLPFSG